MKRSEIIATVTEHAVNTFEFSCSWRSIPAVIEEELRFHGIKPNKPLVFWILNLAKLAWAGEVERVKNIINQDE